MSTAITSPDRPRVVVSCRAFPETLELLAEHAEVVPNPGEDALSPAELRDRCRDADALLAFMPDRIDAEFLDACSRLRVVGCALKGFDNFDVDACTDRGVWVSIVPDLLTEPTAELAVGLMIGIGRNMLAGDRLVRREFQGWRPTLYGAGLAGATVGIVGMGKVGRAVAARLQGFQARLIYHDATALSSHDEAAFGLRSASLEELARESDFIVLAVPLNQNTRNMVDASFLASVRAGAYLVNPARGSVVDETAVAEALKSGKLAGYAADTFPFEDWALADRPSAVHPDLLTNPDRTLLTPHIGSAVTDVRREIERDAALNIVEALRGERPHGAINDPRPLRAAAARR